MEDKWAFKRLKTALIAQRSSKAALLRAKRTARCARCKALFLSVYPFQAYGISETQFNFGENKSLVSGLCARRLSYEREFVGINPRHLTKLNSTFFHRQRKKPSFLTVKSEEMREKLDPSLPLRP